MKQRFAKLHTLFSDGPGKSLLRTAAAVVLSAAVLVTSGYAWYVRNIYLQSRSGMVLTSIGDGAYATTYSVYLYNPDFTDVDCHTAEQVQLHGYDTVFTERNEFTPAIVCIPVFGTSVTDGTSFTVNVECSGEMFETENPLTNTKMVAALSNVVSLRCATLDIVPPGASNETYATNYQFYNAVHMALQNTTATPFIDYSAGNAELSQWEKSTTLSFSVTPSAGELRYVYVEIDYDALLVSTYRVQNEGNASGESGSGGSSGDIFSGALSWTCEGDLTAIYFS